MKRVFPIILILKLLVTTGCRESESFPPSVEYDTQAIVAEAEGYLQQPPAPITGFSSERSPGGLHNFYSEGDYWWPNPEDPDGAYVRRDGQRNPENFTAHREAMRDLSRWVAALTSAYKVTGEERYARHALLHLKSWFINPQTRMNPNLIYAQAIKGRVTGRGIGIIDAIHLIEVAKSIKELHRLGFLSDDLFRSLQGWFGQFLSWMTTHRYGIDERDQGNNHGTWWAAQVAAYADLADRPNLMEVARRQFKELLSSQMDRTGGFPDELRRTKPYNYSLFNLEGFAVLAQIASTEADNLWTYRAKHGSLRKAWDFMYPFLADKSSWVKPPDAQHFDELPIQSCGLLFAGMAYSEKDFLQLWEGLSPVRKSKEVDRSFPLRQPILWIPQSAATQVAPGPGRR